MLIPKVNQDKGHSKFCCILVICSMLQKASHEFLHCFISQ